jgi:hypothetical protein
LIEVDAIFDPHAGGPLDPAVYPRALDHIDDGNAALFVKSDFGDAASPGGNEIGAAGMAAIGRGLLRRRALSGNEAIEHWEEELGIGRIAGLDNDI